MKREAGTWGHEHPVAVFTLGVLVALVSVATFKALSGSATVAARAALISVLAITVAQRE
jgi:hypothetical protein